MKTIVLYHAQCRDGWAAAWAAARAMPGADLVPVMYGQRFEDVTRLDYASDDIERVVLVDFSFPRSEMLDLAEVADVSVYDHHKTAQAALDGLAEELDRMGVSHGPIVFDMERSGAGIAWDELCGSNRPEVKARWSGQCPECWDVGHGMSHDPGCPARAPWLIRYVEDRDLWRWALPNSREVNAYLSVLPYGKPEHLAAWDEAERLPLTEAIAAGKIALQAIQRYAENVADNALRRNIKGWEVPSVNAPQHDISEVLERLLDMNPGVAFVHGWWQRPDGMFSQSLRSRGEFDVSVVAKAYGGGGHKNAAGFQTKEIIP